MALTASRRVFSLAAVFSAALVQLALQPVPAAAASATGTLYSISPSGFVVQVDQASGSETPLINLTPPGLPPGVFAEPGGFASDPVLHRLFGVLTIQDNTVFPSTFRYEVMTIDPTAGTVTDSLDLSQPLQSSVAYDSQAGSLYGITQCCPNELVRIDPLSGVESPVASLGGDATTTFSEMAIDSATQTLYVASSDHSTFPPLTQLLAVNIATHTVSPGQVLQRGVIGLVFDQSLGSVFGVTFCCFDSFLVKINPSNGAETPVAEITNTLLLGSTATIDSATDTVYLINSIFDPTLPTGPATFITSINDKSGATVNGASTLDFLGSLGFLGPSITSDSIKADVNSALTSGAIDSAGVATALVSQLNAASAARTSGQCGTAANIYNAFINAVRAQSGTHIAAATAAQLVSEAQFLIANCP